MGVLAWLGLTPQLARRVEQLELWRGAVEARLDELSEDTRLTLSEINTAIGRLHGEITALRDERESFVHLSTEAVLQGLKEATGALTKGVRDDIGEEMKTLIRVVVKYGERIEEFEKKLAGSGDGE